MFRRSGNHFRGPIGSSRYVLFRFKVDGTQDIWGNNDGIWDIKNRYYPVGKLLIVER